MYSDCLSCQWIKCECMVANFNRIIFMQNLKFYFSQNYFLHLLSYCLHELKIPLSCFSSQHVSYRNLVNIFLTSPYFCKHFWPLYHDVLLLFHHTLSLPPSPLSLQYFSLIAISNLKISWTEAQFWRGSSVLNSSRLSLVDLQLS